MNAVIAPDGFELLDRDSPFSDLTGPYFEKRENGKHIMLGMRVTKNHLNRIRLTHGGVYMTLADNAFGDAIKAECGQDASVITVNFSCQFLASAKEGDWLEARVSFNKIGRKLVFGDCKIFNGETMVFASEAVFSVQIKESKKD